MDKRQEKILKIIVREYIRRAEPISSQLIDRQYKLGCCPATTRRDMSFLEDEGYLIQPHHSAGRVPSDKGYRYYVDNLMEQAPRPAIEELHKKISDLSYDLEETIQKSLEMLSALSGYLTMAVTPASQKSVINKIQLVMLSLTRVLIVLLTSTSIIDRLVLEVEPQFNQEHLNKISNWLNSKLSGKPVNQLRPEIARDFPETWLPLRQLLRRVIDSLREAASDAEKPRVMTSGLSHLLAEPEFTDVQKLKNLFELLDEETEIRQSLEKGRRNTQLTISIGHENGNPVLSQYSIVYAPYYQGEVQLGSVGVLGPTRMKYELASGAVRTMAETLSDFLNDLI